MAEILKLVPGARVSSIREEAKKANKNARGIPNATLQPMPADDKNDIVLIIPRELSDAFATKIVSASRFTVEVPDRRKRVAQRVVLARPKFDAAQGRPIRVYRSSEKNRDFWLYANRVYVTSDQDLSSADVEALVNEADNRRRLRLEKAHALQAMSANLDARSKRQAIPQDVKIVVWNRDGGRCVDCGSQANLEFDHIIPLAMGGANTVRNLQLLCEPCNRRKGATLG